MKNYLMIVTALLAGKMATAQEENTQTVTDPEKSPTTMIIKEEKPKKTIDKGAWLISGRINFASSETEENGYRYNNNDIIDSDETTFSFGFYSQLWYSLGNNWMAGVGIGLGYQEKTLDGYNITDDTHYNSKEKLNNYSMSLKVRRNFSINHNLLLFMEGGLHNSYRITSHTSDINSPSRRLENNELATSIKPGIMFFLNDHLALESSFGDIGYRFTKNDSYRDEYKTNGKTNSFYTDFSPSTLYFGITYIF